MKHHARTIILLALLIGLPATIMQAQPYNISMSISTQNASCYTDGKIFIRLDGTDLGLLSANDQLNFDVFKDGQIYLSHDFFFGDISDSVVVLDGYPAGDYSMNYDLWIGSQAPISGQLGNFKIADKSSKPFVSLSLGSVGTLHGTRPTLKCKPTGRVQLEIIQGKLPYSVQVYKDGALLRTEVFNSPMHSGSDPLAEDYQHYYNIENLAKGTYTFVMTDSCGYQQTLSEGVVIDEAEFTCLPDLISGSISTTKNEVSFTLQSKFFQNVKYDNYPGDYLEFRWGIEGETMSGWLPFVSAVGESVPDAEKYYGKKYVFELRVKNCPNYR